MEVKKKLPYHGISPKSIDWNICQSLNRQIRALERAHIAMELISKRSGKLLDVGCGAGEVSSQFHQLGFDVFGVDTSETAIELTRASGVNTKLIDITKDNIPGQYDIIMCLEVLEHLEDPLSVLRKLRDNLFSADSDLILSLPNEFHVWRRWLVLIGLPDFSRYDWPHLHFFNEAEARRLIDDAGFDCTAIRYIPLLQYKKPITEWIGRLLARFSPSLFALSFVFHLKLKSEVGYSNNTSLN